MKKFIILIAAIVLLIVGGLAASWITLGYWWYALSPCRLAIEQPSRGEIHPPWILPLGTELIENQGGACFYLAPNADSQANNLLIQVYPSGCYSSSCSMVYERTGEIEIDRSVFAIRISSRFVLKPIDSERMGRVCECTADCRGGGFLEFTSGILDNGVYQVYLGDMLLGSLTLPLTNNNLCLDAESNGG